MSEETGKYSQPRQGESIGGLLYLVAIGMICNPFLILNESLEIIEAARNANWNFLWERGPATIIYLALNFVKQAYLLIFSIALVVLFFDKNYRFPKLIIIFLASLLLLDLIAVVLLLSFVPSIDNKVAVESIKHTIYLFFLGLIWIPYFLKSKRVQRTFVNGGTPRQLNGIDKNQAQIEVSQEIKEPSYPERQIQSHSTILKVGPQNHVDANNQKQVNIEAPQNSRHPKRKKLWRFTKLSALIALLASIGITVFVWNDYSDKHNVMVKVRDTTAHSQLIGQERSNLALEHYKNCLEMRTSKSRECLDKYWNLNWTDFLVLRGDKIIDGVGIKEGSGDVEAEVIRRYLQVRHVCFDGNRQEPCRFIPDFYKEQLHIVTVDEFLKTDGPFAILAISLAVFSGLMYCFVSIGFIPDYPHEGWKRLSLVLSSLSSFAVVIYGLSSYDGLFDIEGFPVIIVGIALFPIFFWIFGGARVVAIWIKAGFNN